MGVPCGVVVTCPAHKPEGPGSIPGLVDGNHGVKSETPSLATPVVSRQHKTECMVSQKDVVPSIGESSRIQCNTEECARSLQTKNGTRVSIKAS